MSCHTLVNRRELAPIVVMIVLSVAFGCPSAANAGMIDGLISYCCYGEKLARTLGSPGLDDGADVDGITPGGSDADDHWKLQLDDHPNWPEKTDKALDEISQLAQEEKGLPLIPEPNTLVMLSLAALLVLLWRLKW